MQGTEDAQLTDSIFPLCRDMISKATIWMRREFRVWSGVDIEVRPYAIVLQSTTSSGAYTIVCTL
jgi:hypothetical protein